MKVQITMADELMNKVDTYADEMYTTRSGFITQCVATYIGSLEVQSVIKQLGVTLEKIADMGDIDEETMKELEQYKVICNALTRK